MPELVTPRTATYVCDLAAIFGLSSGFDALGFNYDAWSELTGPLPTDRAVIHSAIRQAVNTALTELIPTYCITTIDRPNPRCQKTAGGT